MAPSLHEACYRGDLAAVTALLDAGADPNGAASDDGSREWISCAGSHPRPLNCVAIAWAATPAHLEIVKRLLERGAVVDQTVLDDLDVESMGTAAWQAMRALLERK